MVRLPRPSGPRPPRRAAALAAAAVAAVALAAACGGPPESEWPGGRGCPPGMAAIDGAYCIDRWEASVVEVTPNGERPHSPYLPLPPRGAKAVSRAGAVPQAYVSRNDAEGACRAAGKRLCSEREWVHACRGRRGATYPYGAVEEKEVCNDSGESPLLRLFGGSGAEVYTDRPMNDPRLNQLARTVAPSGSHRRCASDYGVFDMVGNVHEWIDDPGGTFVGGYYLDTKLNGRGCSYKTTAHDAAYHDYSTGFRCCAAAAGGR